MTFFERLEFGLSELLMNHKNVLHEPLIISLAEGTRALGYEIKLQYRMAGMFRHQNDLRHVSV